MLLKLLAVIRWLRTSGLTYKGTINVQELVYSILKGLSAGGLAGVVGVVVQAATVIFINPADAVMFTTIVSALTALATAGAALWRRFHSGPVNPDPAPPLVFPPSPPMI
jgi:hypothetical protein